MISQPMELSRELREGSAQLHREVEQRPLQRRMAAGRISRPEYRAWLRQMLLIHQAVNAALPRLAAGSPSLAHLGDFAADKPGLLRADLTALGDAEESAEPLEATRAFVEWVRTDAPPAALVGVLYVLEGSTNGNRIIAARLKAAPPSDALSTRYLDPYGPDQRTRWADFKRMLDAVAFSRRELDSAVDAAQRTFRAVGDMGELLAAEG